MGRMTLYEQARQQALQQAKLRQFQGTRLIGRILGGIAYDISFSDVSRGTMDDWRRDAYPWRVELTHGFVKLSTLFWTGSGWETPPEIETVLLNLLSEATEYDTTARFEDWADNMALDTDSRRALAAYQQIAENNKLLRHLLGDQYNDLIVMDEEELTDTIKLSCIESDTTTRPKRRRVLVLNS